MRNLTVSLTNEQPDTLTRLLEQIKQIASGTHIAVPSQAPAVKLNTKGRQSTQKKKNRSTSTRRNPSQFEIVEADLKKEKTKRFKADLPDDEGVVSTVPVHFFSSKFLMTNY
ncbi:hypothetical protein MJO29_002517 [Puccinia striiformis f. sp. tritici]|nr:hypothetical protein MJO29_002517 [Puccinia striiformis f. sp. tritici]